MSGHNWHCTNRQLSLSDIWPQRCVLCSIPRRRWYSLPRYRQSYKCFRFFGFQFEWHLRKLINGASTRFLHFDNHQGVGWRDVDIVRCSIYWVSGRSHELNNFFGFDVCLRRNLMTLWLWEKKRRLYILIQRSQRQMSLLRSIGCRSLCSDDNQGIGRRNGDRWWISVHIIWIRGGKI